MTWQWLADRAGAVPQVLAGPIVRRVDPDSASVWIATRDPVLVELSIYEEPGTTVVAAGERRTVQIGEHLSVAVVTARPQSAKFGPGTLYGYDLRVGGRALADAMGTPDLGPIAYAPSVRPTFSLPPKDLGGVRLVHASCRKSGGEAFDALPVLDAEIADARATGGDAQFASVRPHQLFLTGDQIYADDLPNAFLSMCLDAAGWLMGSRREPTPRTVGPSVVKGSPTRPWPTPGSPPAFPTIPAWRGGTPWDTSKPWPGVCGRGPLAFAAGLTVTPPLPEDRPRPMDVPLNVWDPTKKDTDWSWAGRFYTARNHLMLLGEYYAAYLLSFSPALWCQSGDALPDVPEGVFGDGKEGVGQFGAGVGAVRRALANLPTYMVLDDHEVTDDLYMNRLWCSRVLGLPGDTLGRRIVRNAMVAFALFQAWGNEPDRFESGPGAELLDLLGASGEMNVTDAADRAAELVGIPPALGPAEVRLRRPEGAIDWHYAWNPAGWSYEVRALDCRTARRYGPGGLDPPQLIDDGTDAQGHRGVARDEFVAQLGADPAPDGLISIVIAPTPILGIRWVEDRFQRTSDLKGTFENDAEAWSLSAPGFQQVLARLAKHNPRTLVLSGDVHYSFAAAADYWATLPWGDQAPLSAERVARVVQLCSSAAKNETGLTRSVGKVGWRGDHMAGILHLLSTQNPQTWFGRADPHPIDPAAMMDYVPSPDVGISPSVPAAGRTVNQAPVVVTMDQWLSLYGGQERRPIPDWIYRIEFFDGEQREFKHPQPVSSWGGSIKELVSRVRGVAGAVGTWYDHVGGSSVVGLNNICALQFGGSGPADWRVIQQVKWRTDKAPTRPWRPGDVDAWRPSAGTTFTVPFQVGKKPTVFGT
jgi:hypothetical protein